MLFPDFNDSSFCGSFLNLTLSNKDARALLDIGDIICAPIEHPYKLLKP